MDEKGFFVWQRLTDMKVRKFRMKKNAKDHKRKGFLEARSFRYMTVRRENNADTHELLALMTYFHINNTWKLIQLQTNKFSQKITY